MTARTQIVLSLLAVVAVTLAVCLVFGDVGSLVVLLALVAVNVAAAVAVLRAQWRWRKPAQGGIR